MWVIRNSALAHNENRLPSSILFLIVYCFINQVNLNFKSYVNTYTPKNVIFSSNEFTCTKIEAEKAANAMQSNNISALFPLYLFISNGLKKNMYF